MSVAPWLRLPRDADQDSGAGRAVVAIRLRRIACVREVTTLVRKAGVAGPIDRVAWSVKCRGRAMCPATLSAARDAYVIRTRLIDFLSDSPPRLLPRKLLVLQPVRNDRVG